MTNTSTTETMTAQKTLEAKIFRAFAYGYICGEVADHFEITIKEARQYLKAFKAQS